MPTRAPAKSDHTIYSDDPVLDLFGLAMFNIVSLKRFCDTQELELSYVDYLTVHSDGSPSTSQELYDAFLGISPAVDPEFNYWNPVTREYELSGIGEYAPILNGQGGQIESAVEANRIFMSEKHRFSNDDTDFYASVSYTPEENVEFISDIKKSADNHIYWTPTLFRVVAGAVTVIEFNPTLRLYLQDPTVVTNKSVIVSKAPIISDVPKTAGGTRWGVTNTAKNSQDGIGAVRPPIDGDEDNPDNKRVGQLDTHFNQNTGKYESGTRQVLGVLLGDLAPVVRPAIDPSDIQSRDTSDFYSADGNVNQLGDWSKSLHTAQAMVIEVQKANPYLFGPNFIKKHNDSPEKEVVQVVNRTPASFVQGEFVMLSYIGGEWIPQKFGEGTTGTKLTFGVKNWSFTKVMADSDSYFRDRRYFDDYDSAPSYARGQIDPDSYEQLMRNKFYASLYETQNLTYQTNAVLNFYPLEEASDDVYATWIDNFFGDPSLWDFQASPRYWQFTAFDQMGEFAGGKNDKNIIARTNYLSAPSLEQDSEANIPSSKWLEFWGPSFVDGYSSEDVQRLLSTRASVDMSSAGQSSEDFFFKPGTNGFNATSSSPAFVDVGNGLDRNWSKDYPSPGGMFGDSSDRRAKNLPAEVATNSFPSEDDLGSPLEDLRYMITNYGCSTSGMLSETNNIFARDLVTGEQVRFNWLYKVDTEAEDSGVYDPVYNLSPVSPNRVDFFPLYAEAVSSTNYVTSGDSKVFGNDTMGDWYLQFADYPNHMLGGDWIYSRNAHCGTDHFTQNFVADNPDNQLEGTLEVLPHDQYVDRRSVGGVGQINQPDIWDEDHHSADAVGVISAKCRINFRGNELRFNLDQQLGLRTQRVVRAGDSASTFSTALRTALTGAFGVDQTFPRWGGAGDRPYDFHTTALHVKVFDSWPVEQTIYDPRYFGVLHFNDGVLGSSVSVESEITVEGSGGNYNPDKVESKVDFRVPTSADNEILAEGRLAEDVVFAPEKYWRVDPRRRGMMLTKGGYRYFKRVCGFDPESIEITDAGTGYLVGDILDVSGGGRSVIIEVVSVGSGGELSEASFKYTSLGEGFTPTDFERERVSLIGGSGSGAQIRFTAGLIYSQVLTDEGPKNHSDGYTRLTDSNNRGFGNQGGGMIEGAAERGITISEPNNDDEYDLFFHFHNDITHTVHSVDTFFYNPVQRLLLEINGV